MKKTIVAVSNEGHLFTEGRITKDYPEQIKAQIAALPPDASIIIHHISSPGGDCYAAYKGYHELMKIGKPIHSVIEGEAQSMATFLAIAPAAKVEILEPSTFMIHEPYFPEGVAGTVDELESAKVELTQIRDAMAQAYSKKTGKPLEQILQMMKKTTRLDARMTKNEGFADVYTEQPRRIAAEFIEEFKTFKTEIMNLFKKHSPAMGAQAVDLPLKAGGMIHVESENGDLVNKPVTIDGKPAEGTYELADGRTLTCAGGMVTMVGEGPQETAEQKLAKQLQATQAQLATLQAAEAEKAKAAQEALLAAEKAKAEEAIKAVEEKDKAIVALQKQVDDFKQAGVGDQGSPKDDRVAPAPFMISKNDNGRKAIMATRSFLADNFAYLEKHYKGGKYADGTEFQSYRTMGGPNAVSILETNFGYTWQGVLTTDLFFTPSLGSPALSDLFTIDLGAKDKKRYNIVPTLSNVLKPYTGCDQAVTGSSMDLTDKAIQLKPFQMYEGWCKDDFTNQLTGTFNHLAQEWLKSGNASFDPAGTPIDKIIVQSLKDSLRRDVFRRASFGNVGDSSVNYSQIDGLFTTLYDQSGASNYCVYASKTNFGTGSLAANAASTEFLAMYNDSDLLLKEQVIDSGKGAYWVTRSLWENYYTTLVGVGAVTEQAYADYKNGIKGPLTFRGIPVLPITIWDSFLAEPTNPFYAVTRHIAILGTRDNFILGVEDTSDLNKIDSWFEMKDNKRYYRSNMNFGVLAPLLCDLVTISY